MILVVYAANLLAHEVCAVEKHITSPKFNPQLLQEVGAVNLLPKCRGIAEAVMAGEGRLVN
jgi:hypothetical protein